MVAHARAPALLGGSVMLAHSLAPARGGAPYFVVSPHLDDAVFSCGMLLASHPGSIVCTVFCGEPDPAQQTPWDASAGYEDSSVAMRARIAEDEQALAIVGARALRLPFLDSQYGDTPSLEDLAGALTCAWRRTGAPRLVAPLGLYHSDHVLVGDACRLIAQRERLNDVVVYEDALYRAIEDIASRRYAELGENGIGFAPLPEPIARTVHHAGAADVKRRAVRAYRSQLRALDDPDPHDLAEPERYMQLVIDPARQPPA